MIVLSIRKIVLARVLKIHIRPPGTATNVPSNARRGGRRRDAILLGTTLWVEGSRLQGPKTQQPRNNTL